MLKHVVPGKLNDFFLPLSNRPEKGIYFCRIAGYTPAIEEFIKQYYDCARRTGVIIDGRIPNPDTNNLSYFSEMMGAEFRLDTRQVRETLGEGISLAEPEVVLWLRDYIQEQERSLRDEKKGMNA